MSIDPIENEPRRLVPLRGHETQGKDKDVTPPEVSPAEPDSAKDRGGLVGFLGTAVGVSLALVIVAPVTLSAQHLITWASSAAGLGLPIYFAWVVFLALDLAAVTCIGMVTLCALRGEGAGGFSIATWAFAAASAFANYSGGHGAGKWFFPAMSLAGPALLEMVLAKFKRWARVKEGSQMSARPKFGIRWLPGVAFTETRRAWAVARRENITKATDAIALVRELDILAEMSDEDAVRYAQAAVGTVDAYQLRRWLTARGKNVAQTALPAAPVSTVDEDIVREGAPMAEMFAPMPKPLRAQREALGLPAAPEPVKLPEPQPKRVRAPKSAQVKPTAASQIKRLRTQDHPKWADTEAIFRESLRKGAELSQRKLSEVAGVHRNVAKAVIDHVKDDVFPEG